MTILRDSPSVVYTTGSSARWVLVTFVTFVTVCVSIQTFQQSQTTGLYPSSVWSL